MIKIVDRYIVRELLPFFLFFVAGSLLIMVSITLIEYLEKVFKFGWSVSDLGYLLLYDLPKQIVMSLPVAYLGGTVMTFGRLGKDGEITALRAAGTTFRRLTVPVLVVSLAVSYGGFLLNEDAVPWANARREELVRRKMGNAERMDVEERYFKGLDARFFYVARADKRLKTMYDVLIHDVRNPKRPVSIAARSGTWNGTEWTLNDVLQHSYGPDGYVLHEDRMEKLALDVKIKMERVIAEQTQPQNLPLEELEALIVTLKEGGLDTKVLEVERHYRYAVPLASFFSAVISAPLGLMFSRLGNYIGVAISILLLFVYFVILSIGKAVGEFGVAPAWLAAWAQNYIFLVVGAFLLWRIDR